MTARSEQETTVTSGRDEPFVYIWSNNLVHVRRLRKDARVAQIDGDDTGGHFKVPSGLFDPLKGFRRTRRPMTDAEREAAADRLSAARQKAVLS